MHKIVACQDENLKGSTCAGSNFKRAQRGPEGAEGRTPGVILAPQPICSKMTI